MVKELSKEAEAAFYLRQGKRSWDPYQKNFNLEQGFKCFLTAAESQNSEAMFIVANAYLHGRGTEKNEEIAYHWFRKAAEAGIGDAQMIMGERAEDNGDQDAALHWYEEAENKDIFMSDERKRLLLIKKHHRNISDTFEWHKEGADLGIALECYRIGMMYYKGEGVAQDYQLAEEYLRQASHAEGIDQERVSEALGDIYAFHLNDPLHSFEYYYSMENGATILAKKVEIMRSKIGYFKRKKFDADYKAWVDRMKQFEEYQKKMTEEIRDC